MSVTEPVVETFPSSRDLRLQLGKVMQEADALKSLIKVAEKIELYRERRRAVAEEKGGVVSPMRK
jgi:hypothetical protein